jgi:N-methylhydantoinase A
MDQSSVRVGIDVGGTFTDVVAWEPASGRLISFKLPSTPPQLAEGVLAALTQLAQENSDRPLGDVIHATTVATNAVLEGQGADTALVTTAGFRDVLEIGRQSRFDLYHPQDPERPLPLVPRNRRFEVDERVAVEGKVLRPLAANEVARLVEQAKTSGAKAVAVCLLHSYGFPDHERLLAESLRKVFEYVSVSSEINAEFREYERTNTTVVNAMLMPLVSRYIDHLERGLGAHKLRGRLHIVQSNGGMMTSDTARRKPINSALSGPAAGVAAASSLLRQIGLRNAITFDMGGTSTDVCVIHQGEAAVTSERRIGGQPIRLSSVDIETIGAGGGSLAWIDSVGALKVGPQSASAAPGPACYGAGGTEATVTDANLVLGYLSPNAVWGGRIKVKPELAEKAVAAFGAKHGLGLVKAAEGIIEIANSNMLRALRLVSVQRGFDLRDFALVAYGGAGPVHAGRLAQELNVSHVIAPALSGVFSAFGCLATDVRYDRVMTLFKRVDDMTPAELESIFAQIEAEMLKELEREGIPRDSVRLQRSMDLRYVGQNYELKFALGDATDRSDPKRIRAGFDQLHERMYKYVTKQPVECVNLRLSARVPGEVSWPLLPERKPGQALCGTRIAHFRETGKVTLSVLDRERLAVDDVVQGPAAVEDTWSTTLVYPGQSLRVDTYGNLHVTNARALS